MIATICALEWQRLATCPDERIRAIASRLQDDLRLARFFPYASHHDLHISRTTEYPWDSDGLPYIVSRPNDRNRYVTKDGASEPRYEGAIDGAVECFLSLLDMRERP